MNVYCSRCGRLRPHYCKGMCRDCYQTVARKSRARGDRPKQKPHVEPTLEELDRLIAARYATMPPDADTKNRGMSPADDTARRVAGVLRVVMVPRRKWR